METITKEYKVYEFDELSKKAQEKALDNHRDDEVQYWEWYHAVYDQWTEKLNTSGYLDIDISFSGFWSQGDGASFTAKSIDLVEWCKANKKTKKYAKLLNLIKNGTIDVRMWVERIDNHYSHYNTCDVKADVYGGDHTQVHEDLFWSLQKEIEEDREELSKELYKALEEEHEYLTSDDVIKDCFMTREMKFLEDGSDFVE